MHFYTEEPKKKLKEPAAAEESPDQLSKFKELFKKMQEEEKATKKRRTPTKNKGSNESMQSVGTKKGGKQQQQQKQLQQEQRSSSSTTVSSAPGIQKKELAKMVKDLMQKVDFDFYFYQKNLLRRNSKSRLSSASTIMLRTRRTMTDVMKLPRMMTTWTRVKKMKRWTLSAIAQWTRLPSAAKSNVSTADYINGNSYLFDRSGQIQEDRHVGSLARSCPEAETPAGNHQHPPMRKLHQRAPQTRRGLLDDGQSPGGRQCGLILCAHHQLLLFMFGSEHPARTDGPTQLEGRVGGDL
jgi:hypothetical protein